MTFARNEPETPFFSVNITQNCCCSPCIIYSVWSSKYGHSQAPQMGKPFPSRSGENWLGPELFPLLTSCFRTGMTQDVDGWFRNPEKIGFQRFQTTNLNLWCSILSIKKVIPSNFNYAKLRIHSTGSGATASAKTCRMWSKSHPKRSCRRNTNELDPYTV